MDQMLPCACALPLMSQFPSSPTSTAGTRDRPLRKRCTLPSANPCRYSYIHSVISREMGSTSASTSSSTCRVLTITASIPGRTPSAAAAP